MSDHELEVGRQGIASQLGLSPDQLTEAVVERIVADPLFLHHLDACRDDREMLGILLNEPNRGHSDQPNKPTNGELLTRAGTTLARWAAGRFSRVDMQEYQRRLTVCRSCPHLSVPPANMLYRFIGASHDVKSICGLCGCDVGKKAWLATEHCPDKEFGKEGRWESIA